MKEIKEMTNEELCDDLIYWVRVSRNEDGLKGDERKRFKKLVGEIKKRKLLNINRR
jgi:hypothetical protein